ncbi:Uncharacterised protein [uncultured archaeon]|nr:Uncharacterised protein [uncultured archaeon]
MDKMQLIFLAALSALLFVPGCTESDLQAAMVNLTNDLNTSNFTLNASYDIINYTNGTCMAMECENKTPSFPFNLFFDSSLKGGNCSFQPCNITQYRNITFQHAYANLSIRFFMYGAGQSFLAFSDANTYCNNSMKMSVKWLVGSNYSTYPLPDKSRAECFLDKNIIPVYVLYSNFTNVNATRAGQIARNLSGAGPVILVSEADLDDSNSSRYQLVKDEIVAMRSNCPKCLIALGLKLNSTSEYNVTSEMFNSSKPYYVLNNIDMGAYGLNSHQFTMCNPDTMIWYGMAYSKFILHNYTKPSLISYALFDAGNSSDNSCRWYNETAANGYSELYAYINALPSNGIIGVSLYSFYGVGPLMCEDCAFINPNFDQCGASGVQAKIEPRFTDYMGFCQAYYNGISENVSGIQPVVFSNGSQECNFAENSNLPRYLNDSNGQVRPLIPYAVTANKPFFSCAGCFSNGTVPTTFSGVSGDNSKCTQYSPSIEIAADNFDMDPALLRAAVWQESNFDKCAVSHKPVSSTTCNCWAAWPETSTGPEAACSAPNVRPSVANPDGTSCCAFNSDQWYVDITKLGDPVSPCMPASAVPAANRGEECKPCAYGLAQVIEFPSGVYTGNSKALPAPVLACASKMTGGKPDFNPYRPYDGPCDYAYKFMVVNLPASRQKVSSHVFDLDAAGDPNKQEWYSVFLALDLMFGHQKEPECHASSETQDDWISHFAAHKGRTDCGTNPVVCIDGTQRPACCGNKDFLNYMKYCEHNASFSYAYDLLGKYDWLTKNCANSACPDTKMADTNSIEYLCTHGFMEPECCNAARVLGYYSAAAMCVSPPATCAKYCTQAPAVP